MRFQCRCTYGFSAVRRKKLARRLHTYYGPRLGEWDLSYLIRSADRGFSPNPAGAGVDRTFSLDVAPQECGSRTDVRWAEVADDSGVGLRFEGEGMEFSALPYTTHELESAVHPNELPPVQYTVVRAALMQMGLGGDDSWSARPAAEYLLPAKPLMLRFTLRAVGGEDPERG